MHTDTDTAADTNTDGEDITPEALAAADARWEEEMAHNAAERAAELRLFGE